MKPESSHELLSSCLSPIDVNGEEEKEQELFGECMQQRQRQLHWKNLTFKESFYLSMTLPLFLLRVQSSLHSL